MLIQGQEVARDKAAAEKLLRNAAEHGLASAQNDLGFAILNGEFAAHDETEAAMWCQLAGEHETNPSLAARAKINLANAQSKLTPEQREEASKRAANFQPLTTPEMNPIINDWRIHPNYQQEDGHFGH
jgi:TPR repeat protein